MMAGGETGFFPCVHGGAGRFKRKGDLALRGKAEQNVELFLKQGFCAVVMLGRACKKTRKRIRAQTVL